MSDRTEGTIVLSGLLEGRLPDRDDADRRLRDWAAAAAEKGLLLSLEIDAGSFSLLARGEPIDAKRLGDEPDKQIADLLLGLLKLFPGEHRRTLFSTLRSVEYRPGAGVQTVYAVTQDGSIQSAQRSVQAETVAPPRPLTRRQKLRLGGVALVIALAAFGVSAIFVDYRQLFGRLIEGFTPFDAQALQVDAGPFQPYFSVEKKEKVSGKNLIAVTLKRTAAFPLAPGDLDRLASQPSDVAARMVIEALARGYVRCEYFDKDGQFLGFSMERIAGLQSKEIVELQLPMPAQGRLARIVITY